MKRPPESRSGKRPNRRGRPPRSSGEDPVARKPAVPVDLDEALRTIDDLAIKALRRIWTAWLGGMPPRCQSKDALRRLLAWRIQAERYGGLSRDAKRRLKDLAAARQKDSAQLPAPPVTLKPGTMITREWRGTLHRVYVLDRGFAHDGRQYGSLSQVARAIAGTRWSGPRFFGMEARKESKSGVVDSADKATRSP